MSAALVEAPAWAATLETVLRGVLVGQPGAVRGVLVALLAGGHVLLEGPPGLGKTLLVRTLADLLALSFRRIAFTPDLMPADILGTQVLVNAGGGFHFIPGPVFANLVLADEINRATPRTQSALLEAMQERTVTVAGRSRPLPAPFFVLATESAMDGEGLYALPEAQLDRFLLQLRLRLPDEAALRTIAAGAPLSPLSRSPLGDNGSAAERAGEPDQPARAAVPEEAGGTAARGHDWPRAVSPAAAPGATPSVPRLPSPRGRGDLLDGPGLLALQQYVASVPVATFVRDYAVRLMLASRPDQPGAPALVQRYVRYGASPRALQALEAAARAHAVLEGRFNIAIADVRRVAPAVLRHRLRLNVEADVRGVDPESVVTAVLAAVPEERRTRLWPGTGWDALPRRLRHWLRRPA